MLWTFIAFWNILLSQSLTFLQRLHLINFVIFWVHVILTCLIIVSLSFLCTELVLLGHSFHSWATDILLLLYTRCRFDRYLQLKLTLIHFRFLLVGGLLLILFFGQVRILGDISLYEMSFKGHLCLCSWLCLILLFPGLVFLFDT